MRASRARASTDPRPLETLLLLSLLLTVDRLAGVLAPFTSNGMAVITMEPWVSILADVAITNTICIGLFKRKATGGQSVWLFSMGSLCSESTQEVDLTLQAGWKVDDEWADPVFFFDLTDPLWRRALLWEASSRMATIGPEREAAVKR
jgi:hypothetical protein